ncbi:hypothetical protein ABT381_01195 [Streptomyces sp. NPDC000151]|uniref:Rv1733c family protein n=1 Tax=Streptomyces sp. NPDC000151 TaxID=3154244 RepID=UPI003324B465
MPKKWLWRWRSNPLKRPSDVLEAVVLLVAMVLVAVGGPTVAVMTGRAAQDTVREQRQERYPTTAVLVADAPGRTTGAYDMRGAHDTVSATVRWRDERGSVHTGLTQVEPGRKAGTRVPVWLDGRGRLTHQPLPPIAGAVGATLVGGLLALGWCAAVSATVCGVRRYLNHRRARQWDREWSEDGSLTQHKRT